MRTMLLLFLFACVQAPTTTNQHEDTTMGLPLTRERTYTTATPVDPNDMNAIMDCIIGGKRGPLWRKISGHPVGSTSGFAGGNWEAGVYDFNAQVNGARYEFPIDLIEGERLLAVRSLHAGVNVGDISTMELWRNTLTVGGGGVGAQIGATQTTAAIAVNWQLLTLTGLTEQMAASAVTFQRWHVECSVTAFVSNVYFGGVWIQTDIP